MEENNLKFGKEILWQNLRDTGRPSTDVLDLDDCTLNVKLVLRYALEEVRDENPLTDDIYCRLSRFDMRKLLLNHFIDESSYSILDQCLTIEGVRYYWVKDYSEGFLGIYVKGNLYKYIKLKEGV